MVGDTATHTLALNGWEYDGYPLCIPPLVYVYLSSGLHPLPHPSLLTHYIPPAAQVFSLKHLLLYCPLSDTLDLCYDTLATLLPTMGLGPYGQ